MFNCMWPGSKSGERKHHEYTIVYCVTLCTQITEYIKSHKSASAIFGVLIRKQVVFPVIIQFIIHFFLLLVHADFFFS